MQHQILRRNQEIDTINEQIATLKQSGAREVSKSEELAKTLSIATDELAKDREQLKEIDSVITEIDDGLTGRRNGTSFDQGIRVRNSSC